jgi:hypothetical protein
MATAMFSGKFKIIKLRNGWQQLHCPENLKW